MPVPATACPAASPARSYARREPEKSALHLIVREHLETFLATVREERGKDLPRYVEEELRRYLRCGILAHGFLRVVCRTCGEEIVVARSCKCRGACPSCSARRMCGSAAHLVDHVLPADIPVRRRGRDGSRLSVWAAPRTDPSGRNYRTRLLPWVLTSKRSVGQGC